MERKYLASALAALVAVGALFLYARQDSGPAASGLVDPGLVVHGDAAAGESAAAALTVADRQMIVYKTPTCGCCGKWVEHVTGAGYESKVEDMRDLTAVKDRLGVPAHLRSCHTAVVGDYVFEGHVPADLIDRFLAEQPDGALGLVVPGMPVGAPGMEMPGRRDSYDVLLLNRDGTTRVYASR